MILLAGVLLCYGIADQAEWTLFAQAMTLVPAFHLSENRSQWLSNSVRDGALVSGEVLWFPCLVLTLDGHGRGTLSDFWFWIVDYPQALYLQDRLGHGRNLLENSLSGCMMAMRLIGSWGLAGAAGICWLRSPWYKKWAVTGFLLMAILSVMPGKRFYGHYFLHFIPALAIGAAGLVFAVSEWGQSSLPSMKNWLAPALAVILMITTLAAHEAYYFRPNFNKILQQTHGSNPFPESRKLADFLSARYQEGDGLLVLGSEPQLYAHTQAECPTTTSFHGVSPEEPSQRERMAAGSHRCSGGQTPEVCGMGPASPELAAITGSGPEYHQLGWSLIHRDYTPIAWYDQTEGQSFQQHRGR